MSPNNNHAISPVVGTLLMVALTVLLASAVAVLLAGVGIGTLPATPKMVTVTEHRVNMSYVAVTYYGGSDASDLVTLSFKINGATVALPPGSYTLDSTRTTVLPGNGAAVLPVGTTVYVPSNNPGKDQMVVTGGFLDGTTQIVMDKTI